MVVVEVGVGSIAAMVPAQLGQTVEMLQQLLHRSGQARRADDLSQNWALKARADWDGLGEGSGGELLSMPGDRRRVGRCIARQ